MSPLLFALLAPALLQAAPARPPVIALLPAHASSPELARLALLMEARASELLEVTGHFSEVHARQVLAMAGQEGLWPERFAEPEQALAARELLGADRVVTVELSVEGPGLRVKGAVFDGRAPVPYSVDVPADWPTALDRGSEALARALMGDEVATASIWHAQPESRSAAALQALGACWDTVLHQPLGVEARVALTPEELAAAIAACQAALTADASLTFARATLALLQAIGRQDADAEKSVAGFAELSPLEPAALTRFWLLSRAQSTEAGVAFLEKLLSKHPGELLLRSYLGEALASMNQHARAVTAWNGYLALSPASPYALGRLSRSQARLEQVELSLATAKSALERSPRSHEARLQLASRQVDAHRLPDALATLQPLAELKEPPADALLRLGWAHWLSGHVEQAAPLFQAAADRAQGPRAWKTKGRALYNLALVEAKRGHAEAAQAALAKSQATGFVIVAADPLVAAWVKPLTAKAFTPGALYVATEPVVDPGGTLPPTVCPNADAALHAHLEALGAHFAPAGEDKKAAVALLRQHNLKGYQLKLQVLPGSTEKSLQVEMLVMTYPERSLKGSWRVKAAGAKPEALLKVMVPRVVDDAAGDLGWKD